MQQRNDDFQHHLRANWKSRGALGGPYLFSTSLGITPSHAASLMGCRCLRLQRPNWPVSTSSHVRVGYFARLAKVSHLLGLVLNNKFNPTSDSAFNALEAQQLRRILATYAELLPKEACVADCSHFCGPTAICQRLVV